MDYPLVSILIPVFNRELLVGETIESAMAQTYRNIEIIIVDNYSTDNTWKVLQEYAEKDKRIRIFRNTENIGPVRNWKRCIDEAMGEYSGILFSDDTYEANFISEALNLFTIETAFVITKVKVIKDGNVISETDYNNLKQIDSYSFIKDKLLENKHYFPVSPACSLFRTKDLNGSLKLSIPNSEGLVFENYGAGNDLLIFLLIAQRYSNIKITDHFLVKFKSHDESLTISNRLDRYYAYAILFFIQNYYPSLKNKFKTLLFLRFIYKTGYKKIFMYAEGKIDFRYLLKLLIKK